MCMLIGNHMLILKMMVQTDGYVESVGAVTNIGMAFGLIHNMVVGKNLNFSALIVH